MDLSSITLPPIFIITDKLLQLQTSLLLFYSIPNYFDLGKVTKQSCFDAAKIVQNRYKFCPIICKICYLIRFRTLKNSKSTR